jgi:hypothetical protein
MWDMQALADRLAEDAPWGDIREIEFSDVASEVALLQRRLREENAEPHFLPIERPMGAIASRMGMRRDRW